MSNCKFHGCDKPATAFTANSHLGLCNKHAREYLARGSRESDLKPEPITIRGGRIVATQIYQKFNALTTAEADWVN